MNSYHCSLTICPSKIISTITTTTTTTVKSRQSAPTSSTLQVGRGGWASPTCRIHMIQCYMKKYSPYENCSCISYTDQSRAKVKQEPRVVQTRQNSGLCDPWSRGYRVGTVAYTSNGVEHASAVQYGITDCDRDTRNHVPDKQGVVQYRYCTTPC